MATKKAVELLKDIVKFSQKSNGFEQVLKHVSVRFVLLTDQSSRWILNT